jgi:hypothetical protein
MSNHSIERDPASQQPKIFPQRLSDNYKKIINLLRPLRPSNKDSTDPQSIDEIVNDLEHLLNDSMPITEYEFKQRAQEHLHFHRDPAGYCQHLNDAKLRFLVLWTDYKAITNHFRIRNVIHIRWTGDRYECQIFDKTKRIKQASRLANADFDLVESTTAKA